LDELPPVISESPLSKLTGGKVNRNRKGVAGYNLFPSLHNPNLEAETPDWLEGIVQIKDFRITLGYVIKIVILGGPNQVNFLMSQALSAR